MGRAEAELSPDGRVWAGVRRQNGSEKARSVAKRKLVWHVFCCGISDGIPVGARRRLFGASLANLSIFQPVAGYSYSFLLMIVMYVTMRCDVPFTRSVTSPASAVRRRCRSEKVCTHTPAPGDRWLVAGCRGASATVTAPTIGTQLLLRPAVPGGAAAWQP